MPSISHRQRQALMSRVEARKGEIEGLAFTRVHAVSPGATDPQYRDGLRLAVKAAVAYGVTSIGIAGDDLVSVPPLLFAQARLAAQCDVSIDAVLRRYFAGFALILDFILAEARDQQASAVKGFIREQTVRFDRLIDAITREYVDEKERIDRETGSRGMVARVQSALKGEIADLEGINYDVGGCNLGMVGIGKAALDAMKRIAASHGCSIMILRPGPDLVWGWIGSGREFRVDEFDDAISRLTPDVPMAFGEPGAGFTGWKLTHRQAEAALPVSKRRKKVARYREVALLASFMQDDLLVDSLYNIYLRPLESDRDGGTASKQTLRSYFATGRNVSSAAAALGVSRRTVANRLQAIEGKLGWSLGSSLADIEAALLLEELPPSQ